MNHNSTTPTGTMALVAGPHPGVTTGGDRPLRGGQTPLTGGDCPLSGGQTPLTGGDRPLYGGQTPLSGGDRPLSSGRTSLTGGDCPLCGVENRPHDKRYWPQYCKYFEQPTNFTTNTETMEPLEIVDRYYKKNSKAYNILVTHSQLVTDKALWIAQRHPELNPDTEFIEEAGMLHDIGIIKTHAPDLGCFGELPYLCHGYLGREMLEAEGLNDHALVCERHTGVGITAEEVVKNKLPLPERDFVPESVEEQIICFADKFFSKSKDLKKEKSLTEIRNSMGRFGQRNIDRFDEWCELFL